MFHIVSAIQGFFSDQDDVNFGPFTHKLHYILAFGYFLISLAVLASNEFFGNSVTCLTYYTQIDQEVLEDFCWAITPYVDGPPTNR